MRVLHICSYYIVDEFYTLLFSELAKEGVSSKPYIFANRKWEKNEKKFDENVEVSYCFNTFDRFFFHLKHKKVFKDFGKRIDPLQYQCVHAHSLFSNGYIAYLVKKKYNIPYVVTVRVPDIFTFFKWLIYLRPLGRKILKEAEKVIFLSESSKKALAEFVSEEEFKNIENKTHIIPNGIDKFWIENKAVETKKCPQNKKLKLLFVGRVQFVKNADILINVCRKLKEEGIEAELSIVGEMKERRYEKLFAKYDFVKYYPKCKKEELKKHYENADIFILLSHRETFGLVYAEAMSNALPVIYTRGQGFDGQFEDGTVGYACSSTDVNEAVEKVKKVLENYCELSENGRIMFEKFSWEKIASELEEIYEKTSGYIK